MRAKVATRAGCMYRNCRRAATKIYPCFPQDDMSCVNCIDVCAAKEGAKQTANSNLERDGSEDLRSDHSTIASGVRGILCRKMQRKQRISFFLLCFSFYLFRLFFFVSFPNRIGSNQKVNIYQTSIKSQTPSLLRLYIPLIFSLFNLSETFYRQQQKYRNHC